MVPAFVWSLPTVDRVPRIRVQAAHAYPIAMVMKTALLGFDVRRPTRSAPISALSASHVVPIPSVTLVSVLMACVVRVHAKANA